MQFPNQGATATRLSDYFDPISWQCYTKARLLGGVATVENVNNFCHNVLGYQGVADNIRKTAYDWKCLHTGGTLGHYAITLKPFAVGLSVADMCKSVYKGQIASTSSVMERLTDYNSPGGWACWELR